MRKPTRRARRQLQRLCKPAFVVEIHQGEIVRQLERHEQTGARR
jgi:hypothetical protein